MRMETIKIIILDIRTFFILVGLLLLIRPSRQAIHFKPSPCPDTFTYEKTDDDTDRWFGDLSLKINQPADGVSFRIALDKPAQLLVSYTAESTTTDNRIFTGYYSDAELVRGTVFKGRIMVKFDKSSTAPMLESIHINGVRVCPIDPAILSIMQGITPTYTSAPRPDPPNSEVTELTTMKNKPSTGSNNRPVQGNNGDNKGYGGSNKPHNNNNPHSGSNSNQWNQGTVSKTTESNNHNTGSGGNSDVNTENSWSKPTPRPTVVTSSRPSHTVISNTNGGNSGGSSESWNRPNEHSNSNNLNSGSTSLSNNGMTGEFTNNQGGNGDVSNEGDSSVSNHGGSIVPCGTVSVANPLITKGQKTHHGQWPWHIALYKTAGINLSYLCGGSLIAKNKVITAAHCLVSNPGNQIVNFKSLVVYLGKYNLKQYTGETGVQTKEVSSLKVNPAYNSSNFQGDLAILTLSSDVEYTNYVRPVCLWEASNDIEEIENKEGVVAGWGLTENDQTSEELKTATLPVVSTATCIRSHPKFYAEYLSETSFCAGFRNGTSPCNGDSGGGLVFKRQSNTWFLRGIVSLSVAKEGLNFCDPNYYVIFTDTARYVNFIKRNM